MEFVSMSQQYIFLNLGLPWTERSELHLNHTVIESTVTCFPVHIRDVTIRNVAIHHVLQQVAKYTAINNCQSDLIMPFHWSDITSGKLSDQTWSRKELFYGWF